MTSGAPCLQPIALPPTRRGGTRSTTPGVARDGDAFSALTVPAIAESAEIVVEHGDAIATAGPALRGGLRAVDDATPGTATCASSPRAAPLVVALWRDHDARALVEGADDDAASVSAHRTVSVDEYAKAVLYNGLGHYSAARAAAQRACENKDFALFEWALAELVEASVRSGSRGVALGALRRLEERAEATCADWARGIAACGRALVTDGEEAERHYLHAAERLGRTRARVALARVHLLYGEWLRRRGRRLDAREHLDLAHRTFSDLGMGGFADRSRRELLATGETVRKRSVATRSELTPQEAQIAQLAGGGHTNPEIGARLFISARTVEWHLRKVFTKLGVTSRRDLRDIVADAAGGSG